MNNEKYAVPTRTNCSYSTYKNFNDGQYIPIIYPVAVTSEPTLLQNFKPHEFKTHQKLVNIENTCVFYKRLGNT
jgi:hypothetical protein